MIPVDSFELEIDDTFPDGFFIDRGGVRCVAQQKGIGADVVYHPGHASGVLIDLLDSPLGKAVLAFRSGDPHPGLDVLLGFFEIQG